MSNITVTTEPSLISVQQEDGPTISIVNETVSVITVAVEGPQGPRGLQGIPGTDGAQGSDLNYVHNQMSASATWTVAHNLNKFPSTTIVDSSGEVVMGDIDYIDTNNISLSFAGAFSGKAYFN